MDATNGTPTEAVTGQSRGSTSQTGTERAKISTKNTRGDPFLGILLAASRAGTARSNRPTKWRAFIAPTSFLPRRDRAGTANPSFESPRSRPAPRRPLLDGSCPAPGDRQMCAQEIGLVRENPLAYGTAVEVEVGSRVSAQLTARSSLGY